MEPFKIEVQHSEKTVSDLTRAQYAFSHKTTRLIQMFTAIVCILIGVHIIGNVAEPFNYLFTLYGCLCIVFINVPAQSTANHVIEQIKKSGKAFPCSEFIFNEKSFNVRPKDDCGKGEDIDYSRCYRLLRYRHATYFFLNKQTAFIFPDSCVHEQTSKEFQAFLTRQTKIKCQSLYPWMSASIWSIINQKRKA